MVLHSAFTPQVPGHGSTHLLLEQACRRLQSELRIHSGRHPRYGSPNKPDGHLQVQTPFLACAIALAPQGFGLQMSGFGVGLSKSIYFELLYCY